MHIRLFSCGAESDLFNIAVKAKTAAVFGSFSDGPCVIESYRDLHAMLPAFAASLNSSDLTVLFAGTDVFYESKQKLFQILHLKCEISVDVLELLSDSLSAVEKEIYSLFPVNAVIFPSADGVHSAFSCRAGKHHFLLCPIAPGFLTLVEHDVMQWLTVRAPLTADRGDPCQKLCRDASDVLYQRHLSVGIADTATSGFIETPVIALGAHGGCFKFSQEKAGQTKGSPQDFTAQLAGNAAWACNTELGIAMSNVYKLQKRGKEQHVVYISVSYDNIVTVSRVYSGDMEMAAFLKKAAGELFSLLVCTVTEYFIKSEIDDFDVF
ncbi:MAG: hypothetical protein IJ766_09855 [Clostridia bacterium]|nr:hypothetical protein [Clostridia bacterium]